MIIKLLILSAITFAAKPINPCKQQQEKYGGSHKALITCLETETTPQACRPKYEEAIADIRTVHRCLPEVHEGQGTRGEYNLNMGLKSFPDCEKEAQVYRQAGFYKCFVKWNFMAHQNYKLDFPNVDCTSLLDPFFVAKNAFEACMKEKHPGENFKLKVTY